MSESLRFKFFYTLLQLYVITECFHYDRNITKEKDFKVYLEELSCKLSVDLSMIACLEVYYFLSHLLQKV